MADAARLRVLTCARFPSCLRRLFAGSVAQSLGRKDGMSAAGLLAARDENMEVMQMLKRGMSCFSCRGQDAKIPALMDEPAKGSKADTTTVPPRPRGEALAMVRHAKPAGAVKQVPTFMFDYDDSMATDSAIEWQTHEPDPTDIVGTALIFAFMANQKVLPVVELSEKMEAATAHFGELRVPGIDHSFSDLLAKFMVMLGPEGACAVVRATLTNITLTRHSANRSRDALPARPLDDDGASVALRAAPARGRLLGCVPRAWLSQLACAC